MSTKVEFLEKVRAEVKRLRGSVTEIAEKSGFHRAHVWRVLAGKSYNANIISIAVEVVTSRQKELEAQEQEMVRKMAEMEVMQQRAVFG